MSEPHVLWPVEIPRTSCGPGCDGRRPHDVYPDAYCAVGIDWADHPKATFCEQWCRANVLMREMHKMKPPGFTYSCMEDYLLDRAQLWTPAPLPKGVKMGPIKCCYANARKLAMRRSGRFRYVEGLAYCGLFPMSHAWVVDAESRVIDNTWRGPLEGREYFGCVFDLDAIVGSLPVLDDWMHGHPLLKSPRLDTKV